MRIKTNFLAHFWRRIMAVTLALVMMFGSLSSSSVVGVQAGPSTAPLALTNTMTLVVKDVTNGQIINSFKYLINIDNTGTTTQRPDPNTGELPFECTPADPSYPANCSWTSMGIRSSSPVFTQGDQGDFAGGAGFNMPDGRYLVSVRANGYKMDGVHFSVPLQNGGEVTVFMQPYALPDATIQAAVFDDTSPTNGAADVPVERGLAGFVAHINDYIGEVTTDVYGDPLCGTGSCVSMCYVVDGAEDLGTVDPIDADGHCPVTTPGAPFGRTGDLTVIGKVKIPNLGPNRYDLEVIPPDGSTWIQTSTLEGNHGWDAWVMEGSTGLDTEFVVAGEPFPVAIFGFVKPNTPTLSGTGTVSGLVMAVKTYVPSNVDNTGNELQAVLGSRMDHPIANPWISLVALDNGDTAVYIGQGNSDGTFTINNVPDGTYTLAYWDEPQDYILNIMNVTVSNGETVDMGILPLAGWWTQLDGYVFNDLNRNGVMDAGEPGLANFPVAMKKRENSMMDRGAVLVTTDASGYYYMENAYPMNQWLVMEAYSDLYYTTGITYQADNQPDPTTLLGSGVDVNVLPVIGLSGRLDWGVHAYAGAGGTPGIDPDNGGIVGTVSYDTTRNELDPRLAAVEDWQPGIPGMDVNLYAPVACDGVGPCDPTGRYMLAADGSFAKGALLNSVVTETWEQPTGCIARDMNGDPLLYPDGQQVLPLDPDAICLEGPLMGVQFGPMPADGGFGAAVDGNYGFTDGCFGVGGFDTATGECADGSAPTPLTSGDYLVEVISPTDTFGRPLFKVTKEEDINIFDGDEFVPQIPPPECVGPLHTVDVAGDPGGTDNYPAVALPNGIVVPASSPVDNPSYAEGGGSYFEGQQKPLCDMKLVRVSSGRSVAPTFNFFTEVPLPTRFWGLLVDDLNFSTDPKSLMYGEKAGVPFAPVGIYDYTNRLVATVETDYNGLYDVLLTSTNRINCPSPSGVCANSYRFVGNDPGTPGHLNANFKPQFRTIATEFEALPGLIVVTDLAPTQVGLTTQLPSDQFNQVACVVNPAGLAASTPELFAVSQPYVNGSGSFTISGQGFGAAAGQVLLDGVALPVSAWDDGLISTSIPADWPVGPHQLMVVRADGKSTINGLTFHVLGTNVPLFPITPILDNFNRVNSIGFVNQSNARTIQRPRPRRDPASGLGVDWGADGNTVTVYRINAQNAQIRGTGNTQWLSPTFGRSQEAYFTFVKLSTSATEQALFLKFTGNSPSNNNARLIEVQYNATTSTVLVRTKNSGQNLNSATTRLTLTGVTFAVGDQFGARALDDGTVHVFKNGVEIGQVAIPLSGAGSSPWAATGTGRIGLRFNGATTLNDARIDNCGGGNVPVIPVYLPDVYEVGPGRAYATIQSGIDAAASGGNDALVVVYPNLPDFTNPRINARGAYQENLIIYSPIKLQGVGPGGVRLDSSVVDGSIIDGIAFGGDTALADAWRAKIDSLTWVGNQTVSEGQVIYLLAQSEDQYGDSFKASIDGFDIRGGDQQGEANIVTQGGAIFANAFVRNLLITNNLVEGNSASYGAIRIGTPDLENPSNHNENLILAHNRIFANGGTNLAGGVGIFAGADGYEVAFNDICGNFSAEYGGGISVYGFSPDGAIHHNRIYYNQSYDEGGGVMIAGQLPADPSALSPGSGPVDIYNNLIQSNLANDDGGGIRFLMAGNFPMNVYNNIVVNNVSTHEGGGISLNDAPDVRIFNNTIAKNVTTATAVTSNGFPAPAGLSSGRNSDLLQATLPSGAPVFSSPLLFNNLFFDNRAGTLGLGVVTGLSDADANVYDLGVFDGSGVMNVGSSNWLTGNGDPLLVSSYNTSLKFAPWRTNPNFVGAVLVAVDLTPVLHGNYHITGGSPVINACVAGLAGVDMPAFDFDDQPRLLPCDIGADEILP